MDRTFRVMLLGENQRLSNFLTDYLHRHGYETMAALQEPGICAAVACDKPDLMIIDSTPSATDADTLFHDIRTVYQGPVIVLTEPTDTQPMQDDTTLLSDAYVSKPIEPHTLLARMRTLLKRFYGSRGSDLSADMAKRPVLHFGRLLINRPSRKVMFQKKTIPLSSTEFDLLTLLASHAGTILDRDTINRRLRGIPYDGIDRSIDVSVSRLRKKLGDQKGHHSRIKTVWGKGYLFVPDAWE